MVPVRHAGQNDRLEIGEHSFKGLTFHRWMRRQLPCDFPGEYRGSHRQLRDSLDVVGHPISQLMGMTPEFFGVHERSGTGRDH